MKKIQLFVLKKKIRGFIFKIERRKYVNGMNAYIWYNKRQSVLEHWKG